MNGHTDTVYHPIRLMISFLYYSYPTIVTETLNKNWRYSTQPVVFQSLIVINGKNSGNVSD